MAELVKESGSSFVPSKYQQDIFDWVTNGEGSAIVRAVAGSGKTTTLREACRLMKGSVIFLAYNRKIADEIKAKLAIAGIGWVDARTFHSAGLAALKTGYPRLGKPDGNKIEDLCKAMRVPEKQFGLVGKLVSLAKNHGLGIEEDLGESRPWEAIIEHYNLEDEYPSGGMVDFLGEAIRYAQKIVYAGHMNIGQVFDFDDMIYGPLAHDLPIKQYDWVLVDEAQDTNPSRRMLAERMLKPSGRSIWVGDERQAIYGFTGADADALDIIGKKFGCVSLPLTITYRCPKAVVAHAQKWVSHIEAAAEAPEGVYEVLSQDDFRRKHFGRLDRECAVLCRNTRPIVSLAYELIRKKIPCHVEGRDIGKGLVALTKRWKINDAREFLSRLEDWAEDEMAKLKEKRKEREAEALDDKVQTIRVIVSNLKTGGDLYDLRKEITSLFDDVEEGRPSPNVTLSTIHKAKGREWPTVYLWGRTTYMPSKYAKLQWQLDQEENLIYVAVTRAMETLYEVDLTILEEDFVSGEPIVPAIEELYQTEKEKSLQSLRRDMRGALED